MAYREDAGSGTTASTDDVLYVYTDADTITVQEGGTFTASDGTAYTVASDTAVTLSGALSADVVGGEANSTLYYLYGGTKVSDSLLGFFFTDSATVLPSELSKGRRLRGAVHNDVSGNILPFVMTQEWYYYDIAAICTGSDVLELYDSSLSTTFVDIDSSNFVAAGTQMVRASYVGQYTSGSYWMYIRAPGASHAGAVIGLYSGQFDAPVNTATGIFQVSCAAATTTRISLIAYSIIQ